uniref:RxLR effector candidate protein n=1 Tax=Hyaloperonospora arabidopsidis (strain Emoy2) TaxID=559515 RepID=M4BWX1_HYAAE
MSPRHLWHSSVVLIAAALAATSSAVDFAGTSDIIQTPGTVAPGDETSDKDGAFGATGDGNLESPEQWAPPSSDQQPQPTYLLSTVIQTGSHRGDDSNNPGWVQPDSHGSSQGWTSGGNFDHRGWIPPTDQGWMPPTDRGDGNGDQTDWTFPTGSNAGTSPGGESNGHENETKGSEDKNSKSPDEEMDADDDFSLECSGSDEGVKPDNGFSLECSGSDEDVSQESDFSLECSDSDDEDAQDSLTPSNETASAPSLASSSTGDSSTTSTGTNEESDGAEVPSKPVKSTSSSSSDSVSSVTQEGSGETHVSSSKGEHASFGTVTSKPGECVIGDPDEYVTTKDVDWVFENRMGVNQTGNKNWIFDHVVKNKGSLNYCVRWDSKQQLSKTMAAKFKPMLQRQYAAWNRWLVGYGCWPYDEIEINVVGFAVTDASLLDWKDDSLGLIYEGDLDAEGVPQCPQTCYRFLDNAPNTWADTSECKGEPFDLSLWPKDDLVGGLGYDWGQEVNLENMLQSIDMEQLTIIAHEIGHGYGLPDFYEESDKPNLDWPTCIMMAGSSMTITDGDGWMLRRAYESIRSRYDFK